MKNRIWLALSLLAVVVLAGCASGGHERNINDPTNSLVFGYVDMDDAPTSISYASIQQVAPPTEEPYWHMSVRKGIFYSAYLPTGSYQLSSFSSSASVGLLTFCIENFPASNMPDFSVLYLNDPRK